MLSHDIPQFPTNTEWALVRRMCLIDSDGNIQLSPLIESIQLRRYLKIQRAFGDPRLSMHTNIVQQFFEFELDRRHNATLRAIGTNDMGFPFVQFMGKGVDARLMGPRELINFAYQLTHKV